MTGKRTLLKGWKLMGNKKNGLEDRKERLLKTLNKAIKACDPIPYKIFNRVLFEEEGVTELFELEKANPELGIVDLTNRGFKGRWGLSTFSLIATITSFLCDERLGFELDDKECIKSVTWWRPKV